jgi:hypothetical protein
MTYNKIFTEILSETTEAFESSRMTGVSMSKYPNHYHKLSTDKTYHH